MTFRLLASGRDSGSWEVIPHNPLGDVDLRERSAARMKDDREHTLFTVPPMFSAFGFVGELAAAFVSASFIAAIVPHLAPTARALRDVLVRSHQAGSIYTFHGEVRGTGPTRQPDPADPTQGAANARSPLLCWCTQSWG